MAKKFSKISSDILKVLALTGMIAVAATSPYFLVNIAKALKKQKKYFRQDYEDIKVRRALDRLRRSRMIVLKTKGDKFLVELTERGKRKLKEIAIDDLKNKKPKKWDGIWHVIIFDIPEKKKEGRNALRSKMRQLGFYQLQKSVWIFPYPCEEEIELLVEVCDVYPYVNFIKAKKIKDDVKLKRYFGLL